MQSHCLACALAPSLLQCTIHPLVRTGNHNLARRFDVSNEDRVLDRSHSVHDFRELGLIQPYNRGETVTARTPAASAVPDRVGLSRRNILATLRQRIKTLEAKNRELTDLLERAYGVIARHDSVRVHALSRLSICLQTTQGAA
jgi:hypothetical protein